MADEEQQPIDEIPDEGPDGSSQESPDGSTPGDVTPEDAPASAGDADTVQAAADEATAAPASGEGQGEVSDADAAQTATDAASAAADEAMASMLAATQEAIDQSNSGDDAGAGAGSGASAATPPPAGSAPVNLPAFDAASGRHRAEPIDLLNDVHLNVRIELGRTQMFVEDVLKLGDGCVVELDKLAGDPVDVFVNDRCVAKGEVLVLNDQFCVRISEIVDPEAFEELEDSSAA